ncbi:baseplate J/gp47 family protein [Klebsiella pneumoniae]|uniref:baseplate J/gp47 family protein n=1 Tax=Klebsiella pneumoniae TaxID=573 RepID=UPI00164456F0|nr:baseplate J/gp47 family protein [Klebsiella pneumoniae]MBC4203340.1 baseplate J/gp47 family protein [Klebsiella pneumoniae]MDE1562606.1 baseplate J/gp47 family protein [Klebsiella pneumoniae]
MTTISTAVPAVTFSTTGLDVPDEGDILAGRIADIGSAFGTAMSTNLKTPQGQLAVTDTAIIADKNDQLLAIVNNMNPDFSSGRFQDGIGRIYFLDRIAAAGTVVTATCSGVPGTVIPAQSYATDDNGYMYVSLAAGTIGADGTVKIEFQNLTTGPIACPIGTLTNIYVAVSGWSSITNETAGVPGSNVEGRSAFEYRRRQSVARNAFNTAAAVRAAVLEVDGVLDVYVIDNKEPTSVDKGSTNYTLLASSIYIGVYGGAVADIAAAINKKLPPGTVMNGDTTGTVQDTENYDAPYPEYTYRWKTLDAVSVHIKVEYEANDGLPSDINAQIRMVVLNAFTGADGGTRARAGARIYGSRYIGPIQALDAQNMNVLSVQISLYGTTWSSALTMGIDQEPTLDATNIITEAVSE